MPRINITTSFTATTHRNGAVEKFSSKCAKHWWKLKVSDRKKHNNLIKIQLLSPFLFCKVYQDEIWVEWAKKAGLLSQKRIGAIDELSFEEMKNTDLIQMALTTLQKEIVDNNTSNRSIAKFLEEIIDSMEECRKIAKISDALAAVKRKNWFIVARKKLDDFEPLYFSSDKRSHAVFLAAWQVCHYMKLICNGESPLEVYKEDSSLDELTQKLKESGNEFFKKSEFSRAINQYTSILVNKPYVHILYGNRAACYLKKQEYRSALSDGRRVVTLDPSWEKGQYRYAQALVALNQKENACRVLKEAIKTCDTITDLESLLKQLEKPKDEVNKQSKDNKTDTKNGKINNSDVKSIDDILCDDKDESFDDDDDLDDDDDYEDWMSEGDEDEDASDDDNMPQLVSSSDEESANEQKVPELVSDPESDEEEFLNKDSYKSFHTKNEMRKKAVPKTSNISVDFVSKQHYQNFKEHFENTKDFKEKMSKEPNKTKTTTAAAKKKEKKISSRSKQQKSNHRKSFSEDIEELTPLSPLEITKRDLKTAMTEGSRFLLQERCHNAIHEYEKAISIIKTQSDLVSKQEVVILQYAFGVSYLQAGSAMELCESLKHFELINTEFEDMKFPLTYLSIGKVYIKQNIFVKALEPLEKALTFAANEMTVCNWPGVDVIIKESDPALFKNIVIGLIELCNFPPRPNALCRYGDCKQIKTYIYFTDPDFKGFYRFLCTQNCSVEFHSICWKKYKTEVTNKSLEKDYFKDICFTPDCYGVIHTIQVFDEKDKDGRTLHTENLKEPKAPFIDKSKRMLPSSWKRHERYLKKQRLKQIERLCFDDPLISDIEKQIEEDNINDENEEQVKKMKEEIKLASLEGELIEYKKDDNALFPKTKIKKVKSKKAQKSKVKLEIPYAFRQDSTPVPTGAFPPSTHTPFQPPANLQDSINAFEQQWNSSDEMHPYIIDNKHSIVDGFDFDQYNGLVPDPKETALHVFSMFEQILEAKGCADVHNSPDIMEFLNILDANSKLLIEEVGGLRTFLSKCSRFSFDENNRSIVFLTNQKSYYDMCCDNIEQGAFRTPGMNEAPLFLDQLEFQRKRRKRNDSENSMNPHAPMFIPKTSPTNIHSDNDEDDEDEDGSPKYRYLLDTLNDMKPIRNNDPPSPDNDRPFSCLRQLAESFKLTTLMNMDIETNEGPEFINELNITESELKSLEQFNVKFGEKNSRQKFEETLRKSESRFEKSVEVASEKTEEINSNINATLDSQQQSSVLNNIKAPSKLGDINSNIIFADNTVNKVDNKDTSKLDNNGTSQLDDRDIKSEEVSDGTHTETATHSTSNPNNTHIDKGDPMLVGFKINNESLLHQVLPESQEKLKEEKGKKEKKIPKLPTVGPLDDGSEERRSTDDGSKDENTKEEDEEEKIEYVVVDPNNDPFDIKPEERTANVLNEMDPDITAIDLMDRFRPLAKKKGSLNIRVLDACIIKPNNDSTNEQPDEKLDDRLDEICKKDGFVDQFLNVVLGAIPSNSSSPAKQTYACGHPLHDHIHDHKHDLQELKKRKSLDHIHSKDAQRIRMKALLDKKQEKRQDEKSAKIVEIPNNTDIKSKHVKPATTNYDIKPPVSSVHSKQPVTNAGNVIKPPATSDDIKPPALSATARSVKTSSGNTTVPNEQQKTPGCSGNNKENKVLVNSSQNNSKLPVSSSLNNLKPLTDPIQVSTDKQIKTFLSEITEDNAKYNTTPEQLFDTTSHNKSNNINESYLNNSYPVPTNSYPPLCTIEVGIQVNTTKKDRDDYLRKNDLLLNTNKKLIEEMKVAKTYRPKYEELLDDLHKQKVKFTTMLTGFKTEINEQKKSIEKVKRDSTSAQQSLQSEIKKLQMERKDLNGSIKTLNKKIENSKETEYQKALKEKTEQYNEFQKKTNKANTDHLQEKQNQEDIIKSLLSNVTSQRQRAEKVEVALLDVKKNFVASAYQQKAGSVQSIITKMHQLPQTKEIQSSLQIWESYKIHFQTCFERMQEEFASYIQLVIDGTPLEEIPPSQFADPPPFPPMPNIENMGNGNAMVPPNVLQHPNAHPIQQVQAKQPIVQTSNQDTTQLKKGDKKKASIKGSAIDELDDIKHSPRKDETKISNNQLDRMINRLAITFPKLSRDDINNYVTEYCRKHQSVNLAGSKFEGSVSLIERFIRTKKPSAGQFQSPSKSTKQTAKPTPNGNAYGTEANTRRTPKKQVDTSEGQHKRRTRANQVPQSGNSDSWLHQVHSSIQLRKSKSSVFGVEEPCVICYEDMTRESSQKLNCGHTFHKECICSWLNEQRTCPVCRHHALLPDEFPALGH